MKANTISTGSFNPTVAILGLLAALLIFAVLKGWKIPLIASDRAALFVLIILGMVMCAQGGIGKVAASGAWLHPFSILGYLLGVVILLIGLAAVFGKTLPPLVSFSQSFIAVAVLAGLKLLLTSIHQFFL